ncbi:MAG: hypothetical protein JO061_20720, partial [Acidobacteriaceae bacterium]|nr:hypothetical protein [Acidobacteriaceae bacterium]
NELSNELFALQRELLDDFGEKIAIPTKPKKTRARVSAAKTTAKPQPAAPSPQVISLEKQLERQRKKLSELRGTSKPTKAVEDRIYELEDAIRLAQGK